jgi:glycosyltransferase involved in cell wall biosynthesis
VEVVRAMKEPLVELHAQENRNAFNTINRGVAMAAEDCDFIAILNSDDHYHPERFAKLLPVLEEDPQARVVCSGLHIIDENDAALPQEHPRCQWFRAIWSLEPRDDLDMAEWIGLGNFPATTSNILGRADYMAANPMRPYHYNHDYYFLTGAAIRGGLRVVADPLVNYRVHSANTMNTAPAKLMKELLRQQVDFLREFHVEMAADPDMRRRYKLYMQAAFENISAFDTGLFLHVLGHALQSGDTEALDAHVRGLEPADLPELGRFPNRHHVTTWPGGGPLGEASSMPEKLDALRAARDAAKAEATALKTLANALATVATDKRHALGRALGLAPRLDQLPGKSAVEKLDSLRRIAARSPWLKHLAIPG